MELVQELTSYFPALFFSLSYFHPVVSLSVSRVSLSSSLFFQSIAVRWRVRYRDSAKARDEAHKNL